MSKVKSFIPEVWDAAIARQMAAPMPWLPKPTEAERAWFAHRYENLRVRTIPWISMTPDEACAAIRAAADGLQNASVEWGGEADGPAVEGYVAGAICEHPSDSGPCPLSLGHGGTHA